MINIEKELEDFKLALDRYMHLLKGGKIDRSQTLKIEEIQLNIIKKLITERKEDCYSSKTLHDLLNKLEKEGWIYEKISTTAQALGEGRVNPRESLKSIMIGDINASGSKSSLIVLQAISRCLAEIKLEESPIQELTVYCPICGAESRTMVREDDGYYMVCPFCSFKWSISHERLTCPFCGNSNPISLGIFSDKKRRIGLVVCQECGSTWRIIMDRTIKAPRILLPLISLGAEAYRTFVHTDMTVKENSSDSS